MNGFIKLKIVFILSLTLSLCFSLKGADNKNYSFKQISLQDGIPPKINCIHSEKMDLYGQALKTALSDTTERLSELTMRSTGKIHCPATGL